MSVVGADSLADIQSGHPPVDAVWAWLEAVPDPEIPVVSIVDLGIVREVTWIQDELVVVMTPTYSGCPAIQTIKQDICAAIQAQGVQKFRIERRLSPAWTTDWMSKRGREQLRGYGISPPGKVGEQVIDISRISRAQSLDPTPECPHCGSADTRLVSRFGSTPCKAHHRCESCLEPFDHFKEH